MLLRPFDPVVFDRNQTDGGLRYAAPSQIAVDCLTGNGRMPAEGEALLDWMLDNEGAWRLDSLRARCPMTTVDPDTLERDPEVLRDIGRRFRGQIALNADVARSGTIAVGDEVTLVHR